MPARPIGAPPRTVVQTNSVLLAEVAPVNDRLSVTVSMTICAPTLSLFALQRAVGIHHTASGDVVEVNGIEPMTSCLQSRRSPN